MTSSCNCATCTTPPLATPLGMVQCPPLLFSLSYNLPICSFYRLGSKELLSRLSVSARRLFCMVHKDLFMSLVTSNHLITAPLSFPLLSALALRLTILSLIIYGKTSDTDESCEHHQSSPLSTFSHLSQLLSSSVNHHCFRK